MSKRIQIKDFQSAVRAFLELARGAAAGTQFFLGAANSAIIIAGNNTGDISDEFSYSTGSAILFLSLIEAFVRFKIYNHLKYDNDESHAISESTPLIGAEKRGQYREMSKVSSSLMCLVACIYAASLAIKKASAFSNAQVLLDDMQFTHTDTSPERIVWLSLSAFAIIVSLWSSERFYKMAINHLVNKPQSEATELTVPGSTADFQGGDVKLSLKGSQRKNIQSTLISLLEFVDSTAGGTKFVLSAVSNAIILSGNTDYKNTVTLRYSVMIAILLLTLSDAYVHYVMYSHKRYDNDKHLADSKDESMCDNGTMNAQEHAHGHAYECDSSAEALVSADHVEGAHHHGHSSCCAQEHGHGHGHGHANEQLASAFSSVNAGDTEVAHYHGKDHDIALRHKVFSVLCTVSCSIDTASAPSVFMALLRAMKFIPPVTESQRVMEASMTVFSTIMSVWSAPRLYKMTIDHFKTGKGQCACH